MPEKFLKAYAPAATESRICGAWEESGLHLNEKSAGAVPADLFAPHG